MAKIGEKWIEEVFEGQKYKIKKIGREDIFGYKDKLGVVVEEKDWKDSVFVFKNRIYKVGINGKRYHVKRNQVVDYGYNIKKQDTENKVYRYIICAFVFANLQGRLVQPIYFKRFGTIFVVHRNYFPVWLKSLERTYLGEARISVPNMYLGGK